MSQTNNTNNGHEQLLLNIAATNPEESIIVQLRALIDNPVPSPEQSLMVAEFRKLLAAADSSTKELYASFANSFTKDFFTNAIDIPKVCLRFKKTSRNFSKLNLKICLCKKKNFRRS